MGSVFQLLDTVVEGLKTLTEDLVPPPTVFIDAPNTTLLANLARGSSPWFISVFDLADMSRNVTRWGKITLTPVITPCGITSVVDPSVLVTGGTGTITINDVATIGDAVSAVVISGIRGLGVAVGAILGDTVVDLATKLAAAINTADPLNTYITATSAGNVVTCTNVSQFTLKFASFVGNNGTVITEIGRTIRGVQISVFTRTQDERATLGGLVLQRIMNWQINNDFMLPDGTAARLLYKGDRPCKDTHVADIYRWDFTLEAEAGVTTQDVLFSVLVPNFVKAPGINVS